MKENCLCTWAQVAVKSHRALALLLVVLALIGTSGRAVAQTGATITGTLYADANKDGERNLGESGLPGLSVLVSGTGGTYAAVSNAQGVYSVPGVAPGLYSVEGPAIEGLIPVNPASGDIQIEIGANTTIRDNVNFGYEQNCARIVFGRVICRLDQPNCYDIEVTYTNLAPYAVQHVFTVDGGDIIVKSGFSTTNNYIRFPSPLQPGKSISFKITVCNAPPGPFTWMINQHDPEFFNCCPAFGTVILPECKCFQILNEETTCNADGSVTWCAEFQNLEQVKFYMMLVAPPAGLTIDPAYTPLDGIGFGKTWKACIKIWGATPGSTIKLPIIMRDQFTECCRRYIDVKIPLCFCTPEGKCSGKKPRYEDSIDGVPFNVAFPGTVGVITCWDSDLNPPVNSYLNMPVVSVQNLDRYQTQLTTGTFLGSDWVPAGKPRGYHGKITAAAPMGEWNTRNLGSVFGVTLDAHGNIFVTHTSAFSRDYLGLSGKPGTVYLIQNGTGKVYEYITLPNVTSANSSNGYKVSESYPGLGNITYDYDNDQLYVTNLEDGRIYRIAGTGPSGTITSQATWASRFDPADATYGWTPDNNTPGMVNIGERLWGVQYHGGRVYFSRWRVDRGNPNANLFNEIWSVGTTSGDFNGVMQFELAVPHFESFPWSMPVSDISFAANGNMMLAERGLGHLSKTDPFYGTNVGVPDWSHPWTAHSARGIEYKCDGTKWTPTNLNLLIGYTSNNYSGDGQATARSCSGGTDYDYSAARLSSDANSGARTWFTMNGWQVIQPIGPPQLIYGIQGIHPTLGGNVYGSLLQDADGLVTSASYQKTSIGDVEIPCPEPNGVAGRISLLGLANSPAGKVVHVQAYQAGTATLVAEGDTVVDENGKFYADLDLPQGTYRVAVSAKCFLRRAVDNVIAGEQSEPTTFVLIPGDIDGDNTVSLFDYLLLTTHFDQSSSDANWETPVDGYSAKDCDIDGDGAISLFDYLIITEHFDQSGD